jgi:hypothetical protein
VRLGELVAVDFAYLVLVICAEVQGDEEEANAPVGRSKRPVSACLMPSTEKPDCRELVMCYVVLERGPSRRNAVAGRQ